MAAIPLAESALADLKKALRKDLPHVRSSHVTEAIATSLGFKTHAALLAALPGVANDPPFALLDDDRFDQRLQEFGYPPDVEFSFELLDAWDDLVSTGNAYRMDYEYRTAREKAWRNLMLLTINEGLRQKLFSLRSYDNRWPGADPESMGHKGTDCFFDFTLPGGEPIRGYVSDAGFGELDIHAAVHPKGNMVSAFNAGFDAGDAFAAGWLERERGLWLQFSPERFNCRRVMLETLSSLDVQPAGYGDRGKVMT